MGRKVHIQSSHPRHPGSQEVVVQQVVGIDVLPTTNFRDLIVEVEACCLRTQTPKGQSFHVTWNLVLVDPGAWWILVPGGSAPALMMMSQSNLDPSFPSIPQHHSMSHHIQSCATSGVTVRFMPIHAAGSLPGLQNHSLTIIAIFMDLAHPEAKHCIIPAVDKLIAGHQCRKGPSKIQSSQRLCAAFFSSLVLCFLRILVFFQQGQVVSHKFYTNHLLRFIKQRKSEKLFMHLLVGHLWVAFHHRFLIRFMHLCMA